MLTDIKKQWENYKELGKRVSGGKLSKDEFEKQIDAFSFFLSETNQDYYYNSTYLPQYFEEFWHFLECFSRKYVLVKQLFAVAAEYPYVSLIIDCYWQMESTWNEEKQKIIPTYKVHSSYEKKLVCKDRLLIECSVLCGTKRFIYHSKIDKDGIEMQQELQKLTEFLKSEASLINGDKGYTEGKETKI